MVLKLGTCPKTVSLTNVSFSVHHPGVKVMVAALGETFPLPLGSVRMAIVPSMDRSVLCGVYQQKVLAKTQAGWELCAHDARKDIESRLRRR